MIAGLVLDVEAEAPALPGEFCADNRFNARLGGCLGKLHRPVQVVPVGQRNRRQAMPFGQSHYGLNRERGIQERVITVDVKGDAGRGRGAWGAWRAWIGHAPRSLEIGHVASNRQRNRQRRRRKLLGLQDEIMAPKEGVAAVFLAQIVHGAGKALPGIVLPGGSVQGQAAPETALIDIGQLERDQPEAHTAFPCLAQEQNHPGIDFRFQVRRLSQALARLLLVHVVVAHLDREGADAFAVRAHLGHEWSAIRCNVASRNSWSVVSSGNVSCSP